MELFSVTVGDYSTCLVQGHLKYKIFLCPGFSILKLSCNKTAFMTDSHLARTKILDENFENFKSNCKHFLYSTVIKWDFQKVLLVLSWPQPISLYHWTCVNLHKTNKLNLNQSVGALGTCFGALHVSSTYSNFMGFKLCQTTTALKHSIRSSSNMNPGNAF